MSLYKRCRCEGWRCEHPWWYRFRLNRRNYRATTETALKRQALDIEASERRRILEGRHGIRRQPDIAFKTFAEHYLEASAADKTASSNRRDGEIVKVLNRYFGDVVLYELTALRIEHFKRERLAGKWRARGQVSAAKPVKPSTVNRELDTLRAILRWAVKEHKLLESPMADVEHLRVDNRRIQNSPFCSNCCSLPARAWASSWRSLGRMTTARSSISYTPRTGGLVPSR